MAYKAAKKYLRDFLKIAPLSHALWRSVEALSFEQVKLKSPVLDLGCGFGEFAGVVFDQLEMGIDINEKDLSLALQGERYKKLQLADARNLPFPKESYNTVVSVSVMEHIEKAGDVIAEVDRILKKGGLFVFTVPTTKLFNNLFVPKIFNFLGFKSWGERYYELHCKAFKHVNLKPVSWWAKELKNHGFEIVKQEGTISPFLLKLHEFFLVTALPSQVGKLLFGKRFMMTVGLRSTVLPLIFARFVAIDRKSDINVFFVAKKIR